jgi:hypothetical protein
MKQFLAFLLFPVIIFLPFYAIAQDARVNVVIDSSTSLSLSPATPGPNTSVQARLQSSALDLDASTITWTINGRTINSGVGLKQFNFTTGDIDARMVLTARIDSDRGTFTKTAIIEVGSVDLLWQGEGYVAPFYKGRTLWGNQTGLTFYAIPSVSGSNLVYRWTLDGKVQGNSSGVGKNTFFISDSILGLPRAVKIEIVRDQSTVLATASVTISPISPYIHAYEFSPLYGYLFQKEVGSLYAMKEREITFAAFPYFFGPQNRGHQNFGYSWRTDAGALETKSLATYRVPENTSGFSDIILRVTNNSKLTQFASKGFRVTFDKMSSNSI